MAVLGGKGGVDVKFWFCDLRKAHPCTEPRLLTYFASTYVRGGVLAVGDFYTVSHKNSSGDEIANVNFLRPHRTILQNIIRHLRIQHRSKIAILATSLVFNSPPGGGVPLGRSP